MATSPIYNWPEPDNTDLVKNGALAIRTLGNAIDTTMATMVPKTIVDAKGDLIAGTAADTAARLAVGNNGETLVADSSTATGLRYQAPVAANPVLNSAFQIGQRGTSFTVNNAQQYVLDRWYAYTFNNSTYSRQATSDTTNLPFIQYCMRVQRTAGSTSTATLLTHQPMETINSIPFAGKTVTMSFYARKGANFSQASSQLATYLISGTGTDQNYSVGYTGAAFPINAQQATLTTTWQRFSFTGTIAATATELTPYFEYVPTGTAGAADYFEITGVQIEVGSVATPFRTNGATIQGELAACQRYYYRQTSTYVTGTYNLGNAITTGLAYVNVLHPVSMRIPPAAIEVPSTITNIKLTNIFSTNYTITSASYVEGTPNNTVFAFSTSGLTAGQPVWLGNNSTTAGFVGVSAEL